MRVITSIVEVINGSLETVQERHDPFGDSISPRDLLIWFGTPNTIDFEVLTIKIPRIQKTENPIVKCFTTKKLAPKCLNYAIYISIDYPMLKWIKL